MLVDISEANGSFKKVADNKKHILALRNTFDQYINLSKHYAFNSSSIETSISWDKGLQEMSLVEIPSIFYGSSIKKGSVSLKYYITGALAAELRDVKQNGELIQVSGTAGHSTSFNNEVAGVILYNEGFLALTGAWTINGNHTDRYVGTDYSNPKWLHFGAGAEDGMSTANLTASLFEINFEGVNYVPTITMMAHAPKGEMNNSTNPTFVRSGQNKSPSTSSFHFNEYNEVEIKRLEHSPFPDPSGSFVKQTYISKVGIYDKDKNLIGIAKMASPVRKTEEREYTFKMKMDF